MVKSYTSKEQSEMLIKLGIPIETADMYYSKYDTIHANALYGPCDIEYFNIHEYTPCWSLATLLEGVLPNKIVVNHLGYEKSCIFSFSDNSWYLSYYNDVTFCTLVAIIKESLLDACYEMILELHKMNLI